jgi:hypothetical protein
MSIGQVSTPVPDLPLDLRNEYGFPVALGMQARLDRAAKYAAEARERNQPPCNCEACRREALLPAVQNITENWSIQK